MKFRTSLFMLLLPAALLLAAAAMSNGPGAEARSLPQQTEVVTQSITTGARGTDLGEGEADSRFTWNFSGRYTDPRYPSHTTSDGGHGLWIGKHELANCLMGWGRCWSNTDYGPDVPDDMPDYQGVEFYFYAFDLPAAATDLRLSAEGMGADDRLVLLVNDREIGGFSSRASSPTAGIMEDDGGRVTRHVFRSLAQGPLVLDEPSLFLPGQRNVLTFWVNNTGSTDFSAPARPHGMVDISRLSVTALLSYRLPVDQPTSTPVPESTTTPTVLAIPSATLLPEPTPTSVPGTVYLPILLRTEPCGPDYRGADVVLVIDSSSSMAEATSQGGPTKLEAAREAARSFLGQMQSGRDQAGLIQFNQTARVLAPLGGDIAEVSAALDGLEHDLGTRIDLGLALARQQLQFSARKPENNAVLILLTDGRPTGTTPDAVLAEADAVKADLIQVFTIGLGRDLDARLLESVADRRAWFYIAPDTSDLVGIYQRIAYEIPCRPRWP